MQRVIVQVPMNKELKDKAEAVSYDMGFSSLQETIRILLTKLSKNEFSLRFEEVEEISRLSPSAERKFSKALGDIKKNKDIYKPKNKKDFLKQLRS